METASALVTVTALAEAVARRAHEGHLDKSGLPYIAHPLRVAAASERYGPLHAAVGWLHDVVEDTALTLADLLVEGFPVEVVDAVAALTHVDHMPLEDYWAQVAANPIARVVKVFDSLDNLTRPFPSDPEGNERRAKKYVACLCRMMGGKGVWF